MSALQRLHDQLVQADGLECTCDTLGRAHCTAWHAATKQHQYRRPLPPDGQLTLAPNPNQPRVPDSYNQLPDDY